MIFVLVFHDVTKHAFLQALIGNPKVLFLDEPSTGMDATAKRQMWDLINKVSVQRSVVITTHSMEVSKICQHFFHTRCDLFIFIR